MVIGLIVGMALGHIIDSCRIWPMLLTCLLFRAFGLFTMTTFIRDYESQKWLLYMSFFAMTTGTFCQTIIVQSLLNKRMIAPTREIMNGMSQAMRAAGVMTVTGLGGFVSKVDVNGPFFMVGCFDIVASFIVIVLVCSGRLRQ